MEGGRYRLALGAEQAFEPAVAQPIVGCRRRAARVLEHAEQLAQRDQLLLLAARDRVGLARELRLELLARRQQREPLVVEAGGDLELQLAELRPVTVRG